MSMADMTLKHQAISNMLLFDLISSSPSRKIRFGSVRRRPVAYPGILFVGGSTNSVEDRQNGDLGGGSPLVRGSGCSCNLVQEISFHVVKFS